LILHLYTRAQVLEAERKQSDSDQSSVLNSSSRHNAGTNDERNEVATSSASSLSPIGGRVCGDGFTHNNNNGSSSQAFTLTEDALARPKESSMNNHCCG
jgi:hypothetical protein